MCRYCWALGDGTFAASIVVPVGAIPGFVALGDLDGDLVPDVVTANPSSDNLSVVLGLGLGLGNGVFFTAAVAIEVDDGRQDLVALGDLNGDGVLDLVTASRNLTFDDVSVLLGLGDGTFGAARAFRVGDDLQDAPQSMAFGDLNGDGNLDVVAANPFSDEVSVLRGLGDGTFAAVVAVCRG